MRYNQVNPAGFVDPNSKTPANGRGAWNAKGKANGSWRYEYINGKPNIGTNAEVSLDAWATCIGSYGYQRVLITEGFLGPLKAAERGVYGPKTVDAVKAFQDNHSDPETGQHLSVDGTIGTSDARALLTPIIDTAEAKYGIPDHYLRGETNLESALDIGALGYYIYYGAAKSYRGVDRGCSQINSTAHPDVDWDEAFDPYFSIDWSGARMREFYDQYRRGNPKQSVEVCWDAALCAHNNPSAALTWARNGQPPTDAAAAYVSHAKSARY